MKRVLVFLLLIAAPLSLYADTSSGLTIYTLKGCGRCAYTLKYLQTNNINYTEYSTSDPASKNKMWELIRATGQYNGGSISMPVVVINGTTYFNITNLQEFTSSISSKLASGNSASDATISSDETAPSDNFTTSITARHNFHRKNHGAKALKWNSEIQKYAQAWADKIASEDKMYHRQPNKYGENIYWISGGEVNGSSVTDSWYSEIKYYNFQKPGFAMNTGHFTQVVWVGSTELGCGKAKSKRGGTYVVCNYNPPGNYMGRFDTNVLPLNSQSSNSGNSDAGAGTNQTLPTGLYVWTNGNSVVNHAVQGWVQKKLPIANHYTGSQNVVYVAVYSHNKFKSIYPVGGDIYVMGLIRMKGTWNGSIAEPDGWQGKDISASAELKKLAIKYFPACGNDGWLGGDTGGFFGK